MGLYNMRLSASKDPRKTDPKKGFSDFAGNPEYAGDVDLIMKHGLDNVTIEGGRVTLNPESLKKEKSKSSETAIKPATREQSLMESLVEPPPDLSSLPPETDQPGNEGDPEEDASVEGEQEPAGAANNEEAIPAQGTSCSIECIQVSKSNSTALLMY
jgi:hypothetical protein